METHFLQENVKSEHFLTQKHAYKKKMNNTSIYLLIPMRFFLEILFMIFNRIIR